MCNQPREGKATDVCAKVAKIAVNVALISPPTAHTTTGSPRRCGSNPLGSRVWCLSGGNRLTEACFIFCRQLALDRLKSVKSVSDDAPVMDEEQISSPFIWSSAWGARFSPPRRRCCPRALVSPEETYEGLRSRGAAEDLRAALSRARKQRGNSRAAGRESRAERLFRGLIDRQARV